MEERNLLLIRMTQRKRHNNISYQLGRKICHFANMSDLYMNDNPSISKNAADYLVERKINSVGIFS